MGHFDAGTSPRLMQPMNARLLHLAVSSSHALAISLVPSGDRFAKVKMLRYMQQCSMRRSIRLPQMRALDIVDLSKLRPDG